MNALTIPDLNLFNTRKSSYQQKSQNYRKYTKDYDINKEYVSRNMGSPTREQVIHKRGFSSQNRYKQIAENYLQKRTRQPFNYIQTTPYLYNIPSYLYTGSPSRAGKIDPCTCENQAPVRDNYQRKITFNPYVGRKQEVYEKKQPKILKQPYLVPTFRENRGFQEQNLPVKNQSNSSNLITNVVYDQIGNSKIMQKLKTHQSDEQESHRPQILSHPRAQLHQTSIQTESVPIATIQTAIQTTKRSQKPRVQQILEQQKLLIESLKFQVDKQNQFKHELEDLELTKNEYIEKSRQLLYKLNELADDKREFSFILKSIPEKRKNNVFRAFDY